MIISHKYGFIYIRCRKTASTSTEIALSRICGAEDVITVLIWPEDEALRRQSGGRGPQNHLNDNGTTRFYNHMPAAEVRLLVGENVWGSYYKWCVERNPWDKVISDYYFRYRDPMMRPPLLAFLETGLAVPAVNFTRYTVGGQVVVDHIARYERLGVEFEQVAARLGLPVGATMLPRAKAHFRTDRRHYSTSYTPAEHDLVAQMFAEEISLHGYCFDDLSKGLTEAHPAGGKPPATAVARHR